MDAGYTADFVEREYNARLAIPDHPQIFARWAERGARTREQLACRLDLAYGRGEKETLDLFPARDAKAMLVYIHGGYWRSLDKSDFSWLADSYVAAGISVAVVNYTLCPAARMGDIVRQCERAIAWLYTYHRDDGAHRLVVSGHSAGGHLTAMMFLTDWQRFGMPENMVKAGVAISGIFDLEPLLLYSGNADIRLDAAQVAQLSPARFQPRSDAPLALVAGGDESGEFKRQAQLLFDRWAGVCPAGMGAPLHEPGAHHLRVMDRLAEPTSQLYRLARNLCMA